MATKKPTKTKEDLDTDMDFGDMGDFDDELSFDDEDGIDSPNREPSRSQVVTTLGKAAGEGFFEELVTKSAKNVLPEEFEAAHYEAMDLANFGKEVVDRNKEKLTRSAYKLGKEVTKALPFKIKALDDFLEDKASDYEAQKQQSEEQMRDAAVASEITNIFDKQIEVQKAIAAQSSAEGEIDKKERIVQTKMSVDVLTSIDANVSRHTEFSVQIAKEFYRKSLELQFKSYFVQADMLRTMRDHYKGFSIQFTNIEKNTSLPEFVKLQNTERLQDLLRDHATQRVYDQMFTNSKFMQDFKAKVGRYVDDKMSVVTDGMDSFTDMLSGLNGASDMGGSATMMLAEAGAGMGGGLLGERLADMIPEDTRNKIKSNKYIKTAGNYASMMVNSPSTLLKTVLGNLRRKKADFETDDSISGHLGNAITGGLSDMLGAGMPTRVDQSLQSDSYLSHNQPAIFDKKVHRSITEVVPLFLAKILKQNTDLTGMFHMVNSSKLVGFKFAEELMYDYENRKLETIATVADNIQSSVFKKTSQKERAEDTAKDILRKATATNSSDTSLQKGEIKTRNKALSGKGNEKLMAEYVARAREVVGDTLTFEQLTSGEDARLKDIAKSIKGVDALLEGIRKAGIRAQDATALTARMKDSVRDYPIEGVKSLFMAISRLAKAETPHVLSDETATSISAIFSRYMFETNQDITMDGVISRRDLTYIPEKYAKDERVMDALTIFINDLMRIRRDGDWEIVSTADAAFAIMNNDLRGVDSVTKETFQTLKDGFAGIVTQKKVSFENIREGKLGNVAETDFIPISELRDLVRVNRDELKAKRQKTNVENMLDKVAASTSGFLSNATTQIKATGGDPFKMAELVLNSASTAVTEGSAMLDKTAASLKERSGEAISALSGKLDQFGAEKLDKAINGLNAYAEDLDQRVVALRADLAERQRVYDEATSVIEEVSTKVRFGKQIEKLRHSQIRLIEQNIKTIELARGEVKLLADALTERRNNSTGQSVTETVEFVREKVSAAVTRVSDLIDTYEKAVKAAKDEEAVAAAT